MEDKIEIYGIHAILEAIESETNIEKVWLLKGNRGSLFQRLEQSLRQNNIPHSYVPKERLERFKNKNHQGAIATISKIEFIEVEELIESAFKNNDSPTFILLDGITDARNVGAILRSCAATGVNGLIIPQTGSAPINDDTIKTSAGGAFKVPISRVNHLKDAVYLLKSYKTQIISLKKTDKSYGTFNSFKLNFVSKNRIDYVFEKNFKLIDSRHILVKTPDGRWASDHNPVLAKLKF